MIKHSKYSAHNRSQSNSEFDQAHLLSMLCSFGGEQIIREIEKKFVVVDGKIKCPTHFTRV
jgi:hypothetical protein